MITAKMRLQKAERGGEVSTWSMQMSMRLKSSSRPSVALSMASIDCGRRRNRESENREGGIW